MKITGATKTSGIFGHPIGHTLSPVMQNAAFEAAGCDIVYLPFHVSPARLPGAVDAVRALEMVGVNVTIPHKERVMGYLDSVDPTARAIGAVNTVVNSDGRLTGYNTDGEGYMRSLTGETGFVPEGKSVILIGAGGAARAILHALLSGGAASVLIANRTVKRAEDLACDFGGVFEAREVGVSALDAAELARRVEGADLVVNTTSLGMEGSPVLDFPVEALPTGAVVSDIVYRPGDTELLKRASERGLAVHRGIGMLVCQGALGFELWTGLTAPVDVMTRAVMDELSAGPSEGE
ncbi:MAG: shikimate dehydrogenase [Thermodesulfobacteriota bacterium]